MSGSQNALDELRFAQRGSETLWEGLLTPQMLVEMVTINAGRNIALDGTRHRRRVLEPESWTWMS